MGIGAGAGAAIAAGTAAAGGLASGAMQSGASQSAAQTQSQSAQAALAQQQAQYNQTEANLSPFREAGQGQLGALSSLAGSTAGNYYNGFLQDAATADANAHYYDTTAPQNALASGSNQLVNANSLLGNSYGATTQALGTLGGASNYLGAASSDLTAETGAVDQAQNTTNKLAGGLTQSYLDQTPGYQFTLNQGLQGVQSSAAARGLGSSGAAEEAAANYATGLANDTYQNQFQDTLSTAQQQDANAQGFANTASGQLAGASGVVNQGIGQLQAGANYNQTGSDLVNTSLGYNALAGTSLNQGNALASLGSVENAQSGQYQANINSQVGNLYDVASLGENAAAQTGNIGQESANAQSNLLASQGNALAAGQVGSANALAGATGSLGGAASQYLLYQNLLSGGAANGTGMTNNQLASAYSNYYTPSSFGAAAA